MYENVVWKSVFSYVTLTVNEMEFSYYLILYLEYIPSKS